METAGSRWERVIHHPALWVAVVFVVHAVAFLDIKFSEDSHFYVDVARVVVDGEGIGTYQLTLNSREMPERRLGAAPGYPLLLAPWIAAGMTEVTAVRIVDGASVLAMLICMYLLAARIASPNAGIIALILWATTGAHLEYAAHAWTEPPFTALTMLALLLAGLATQGSGRLRYGVLAAAGVTAGLASCTRYVGVALLAAILLAMAWTFIRSSPRPPRWRWIAGAALVSACFAIPFGTAWIRDMVVSNQLTDADTFQREIWRGHWYEYAMRAAVEMGRDTWLLLAVAGTSIALTSRGANGTCAHRWAEAPGVVGPKSQLFMLCAWVAFYLVLITALCAAFGITWVPNRVLQPDSRYLWPAYPAIWVLASAAVTRVSLRTGLRLGTTGLTVVALVLAGNSVLSLMHVKNNIGDGVPIGPLTVRLAEWIDGQTQPDDMIIAQDARYLNYRTRRACVRSGRPIPLLTPERCRVFRSRFRTPYNRMYLCELLEYDTIPAVHDRKRKKQYAAAGLDLTLVKRLQAEGKTALIWLIEDRPRVGSGPGGQSLPE